MYSINIFHVLSMWKIIILIILKYKYNNTFLQQAFRFSVVCFGFQRFRWKEQNIVRIRQCECIVHIRHLSLRHRLTLSCVDEGDLWLGNLSRYPGVNLSEWGCDLMDRRPDAAGVWKGRPCLTESRPFVMEKSCLSWPSHPSPLLDPIINTIAPPGPSRPHRCRLLPLLLSPHIPSYSVSFSSPHLHTPLFCPRVILFMVRLQTWLHHCCSSIFCFLTERCKPLLEVGFWLFNSAQVMSILSLVFFVFYWIISLSLDTYLASPGRGGGRARGRLWAHQRL